jgi:hypothetical protein
MSAARSALPRGGFRSWIWRHDMPVMNYDRDWDRTPATKRERRILKEFWQNFHSRAARRPRLAVPQRRKKLRRAGPFSSAGHERSASSEFGAKRILTVMLFGARETAGINLILPGGGHVLLHIE